MLWFFAMSENRNDFAVEIPVIVLYNDIKKKRIW